MTKKKKAKKKVKSKSKKKKKKKTKTTRESKKGYQVVQRKESVLLEIPHDEEEEEKQEEPSAEERYMEEFRQYIDEDETEEDIGESDREETWDADE